MDSYQSFHQQGFDLYLAPPKEEDQSMLALDLDLKEKKSVARDLPPMKCDPTFPAALNTNNLF